MQKILLHKILANSLLHIICFTVYSEYDKSTVQYILYKLLEPWSCAWNRFVGLDFLTKFSGIDFFTNPISQ